MSERKPVWYAWDSEYPEEGSVVVQADTEEEAKREAADLLDMEVEHVAVGLSHEAQVAKMRALKTALDQERARGAVARGLLAEAIDFIPRGTDYLNRLRCRIAAEFRNQPPSPAVAALLELAEAAGEPQDAGVDGILPARQRIWVSRRLAAALNRWEEVRHG